MNVPADDHDLANALVGIDGLHPPAPGRDWSPAVLHAAVRHRQQRRLTMAALAVAIVALLGVVRRAPDPAVDDGSLALQAEVRALQAQLRALRARWQPIAAAPLPQPTAHDRTAVRLELAHAGAEASRAFAQPKETR